MNRLLIIVIVSLAATVAADTIPELDGIASNITHQINGLSPDFLESNNITLPDAGETLEEADRLFKEKCIKQSGGVEAYDKAKGAQEVLKTCIENLINFEEIKKEMDRLKPTGDLDQVFKKYCGRSEQMKQCVSSFTDTLDPCLNEEERDNKKVVHNITDSLAKFICFKEGDRIALFIAEGGFECLESKSEEIQNCLNGTMSKHMTNEVPTLDNLPELVFKAEQCDDVAKLETCIVKELEKCSEPTPANIVESLFKFVREMTPCKKLQVRGSPSSAALLNSVFYTSILGLIALLVIS